MIRFEPGYICVYKKPWTNTQTEFCQSMNILLALQCNKNIIDCNNKTIVTN